MSIDEQPPTFPRAPTLVVRLTRPFQKFVELEAASSILLLAMTIVALIWANSPYRHGYEELKHLPLRVGVGAFTLSLPLEAWVNDALMAIFFFVVGLEIKRELVHGELSSRARAMLPVVGGLGGMVVPAGIYALFHAGGPAIHGWGIPMATDIAFAIAAISVFGSRVPPGLKIFLLALAIADDLGAVAVIAVFYTADLSLEWGALAVLGLVLIFALNRAGVRSYGVYALAGGAVWLATLHSGVHATVAGVALGFLTPSRPENELEEHETLVSRGMHALDRLRGLLSREVDHGGHERHRAVRELHHVGRSVLSPLDLLTNVLHPWVAFVIMPVFALTNAGVAFETQTLGDPMAQRVGLAVALGLLLGKPVGVTLLSFVAVRLGVAALPRGVNWRAIFATGALAGIGFTVALFITALAFEDPRFVAGSKIGVLAGSTLATLLGVTLLRRALPPPEEASAP